jgi:3-isopropylmalate/(R)-2-methylmalate dehydratase small subunit
MKELAKHVMEDLDPEFYNKIDRGGFYCSGSNFGCGSSREQAPLAIINADISAVLPNRLPAFFIAIALIQGCRSLNAILI